MPIPDLPDSCWEIDPACLTGDWESLSPEVQARGLALATATLRRLTLGRVGGCPITVRPCPKPGCGGIPLGLMYGSYDQAGAYGLPFYPYQQIDGSIINCCPAASCNCEASCQVVMDTYVGRIDSIKIGGVEKYTGHESDFRIDNDDTITYTGTDTCPFPTHQTMGLPDTQPDTFSITYLPTHEVDGLGAWAAGILAVEFAKACAGSKCRLPLGTTAVVRQGVSLTITPGMFPDGFTGIREVDTYIALWNPNGDKVRSQVWSPDTRGARVMR